MQWTNYNREKDFFNPLKKKKNNLTAEYLNI